MGVLALTAGLPQTSSAQTDPDLQYYKEPGIYPTRSYLNQHFSETIDPFTGRLQLHYVDLYIPGNGGFDLEITRSYTSVDDPINPAATPTPFGVGWTMHFGRVLRRSDLSLCDFAQAQGSRMPVLELPNGSRQILFRDDFSPLAGAGGVITTTRWRAECKLDAPTGLRVFAPNGTRYEMTQQGNAPIGQNAWYTTRIIDRNGNTMSINYNTQSFAPAIVPSSITTSDGRSVNFGYSGTGFNTHLTTISDGTRTWTYTYKQVAGGWFLTQVAPPAGGSWQYAYKEAFDGIPGLYSIKTLTYPQGGTINYSYKSVLFVSGPSAVMNTAVGQKTASGGTWTFNYTPSTGFNINDTTTAITPSGTITYQHVGYNTVGVGTYWKFGLLVSKQIGSEQTETYTWTNQTISDQDNIRPGSTLAADQTANAPVLSQKSVTRNGNTYTTTYSLFDTFGNAQTVNELSTGFSRTTSLTFAINTSLWKIHQVKDESFDGFSILRTIEPNGDVTQETRFGVTTNYVYDSQGNLSVRRNARNIPTTFTDYLRGIPRTELHPEGVTIRRVVSAAGNVTSETDGKGDTTGYNYDGLNRLAGIPAINFPRAAAADVSIVWGTTTRTLTRGTFTQTLSYDGFGRIGSIDSRDSGSPSQNSIITMRYDPLGRREFQSYPNSTTVGTNYTYDILDRVKNVTHPDGTNRFHTYNATNVNVKNERNFNHSFSYRAFGDPDRRELIGITVPTPNASISFPRNPIGQIIQVTQGGLSRDYTYYPATNFLWKVTNPETGVTEFGRDEVGNMTSRKVGASPTTIYQYDGLNRLFFIDYPVPTPDVTKTYYGDGSLKDVINGSATRHFDYDPDKNLTLERLTIDGATYEINHSYSANDARDSTTYPTGTIVTYAANGFGRPRKALPFLNSVDYHPTGEVKTIEYANGVTTSVTLNNRLWPQRFTSLKSGTTTVADFQYTSYDGVGNVTSFQDFVDTTNTIPTLSYDEIDRLVAASSNGEARSFAYDGVGNLTSQTLGTGTMIYSYNPPANNRLTGISGARSYSFQYDIYGNVAHNGSQSFTYNDAGQMTCARCALADESTYLYDGLDMRVRAQRSGVKTYFMYGLDGNLLFETTPSTASGGVETKEYVYLSGRQVAVRSITRSPTTTSAPVASISASVGCVTLTVSVSGASPTGTVTFRNGSTDLGTANVINRSASLTICSLTVGSHTIVATYSGDANNLPSSATFTVTIYDLSWLPAILQLLLDD